VPGLLLGLDADRAPVLSASCLESHVAVGQREQRVIAADADVVSRMELSATLANDDRTGADRLAAIDLDAEPLCLRVAPVAR
jgi:hypothetical protein